MIIGERFPQLLQGPLRAGMIRDTSVQDSASAQFHEDEHIKDTESGCDHDEEVAGHHRLGVIANEVSRPSPLEVKVILIDRVLNWPIHFDVNGFPVSPADFLAIEDLSPPSTEYVNTRLTRVGRS